MAEISGGELLLKCLQKEGVERIFAIPDFAYNTVLGKVNEYGIRWITPRHESAAAHMAQGVYKTTGEIQVVMSGAGPGTANLMPGILCAKEEGVPIIAITAQRRSEVIYPAKSGVFQGLDQYDIFKPITKWNAVVHSWERIPEIVQTAYRMATAGRPGPVQIDIPDTIFYAAGDDSKIRILEPHQYRVPLVEPSRSQISEAAKLIAKAKNPLIIAGSGVLNSGGWDELVELAELLNCPATTTAGSRGVISQEHSNSLLTWGDGSMTARKEADVILAVGTRLGELDLPFDPFWGDAEKQKIIQIDIDPTNIGVNRPIALGIVSDAKAAFRALVDEMKSMNVKPSDGNKLKEYKKLEQDWEAELKQPIRSYEGESIHPAHSVEAARKAFPADAINVGDGGNTSLFNTLFTDYTNPRTALGIFEFGHLGTGIPQAIGAKLARPDKDVYVINGDGAAGFNIMELETAVREKIKITVLIHAERSWCMEEVTQIMEFGDPSKVVGCAQHPVRWDKIAEGIGCHGEYVEKIEDLPDAIKRAKDSELPAVVHVATDKASNLMPPAADKFGVVYSGV
jgi:acetolactate synthase-1/2/3 large subunit